MKYFNVKKLSLFLLTTNFLLISSVYAITSHSVVKPNIYAPQEQRLIINSQTPQRYSPQNPFYTNLGYSNMQITCNNNQQLMGVSQSGYSDPGPPPPNVWAQGKTVYQGGMLYRPICTNSSWSSKCPPAYQTWAKEFSRLDTMKLTCAENTFVWRPVSQGGP